MGRYRFIDPELHRIEISDGDWIDVDKEINFRDSLEALRLGRQGKSIEVLAGLIRGWSLCDRDDKPTPINEDTIANLEPETADEIAVAISEYRMQFDEEKKAPKSSAKLEAL